MDKKNYFNVIDFGSSKIRFSVFDFELNNKYSDSKKTYINENFQNHFETIEKIIKNAEKKISFHVEDAILLIDSSKLFAIDISLNKNLNRNIEVSKIYDQLILELNQLVSSYYNNFRLVHIIMDKCIIDNKEVFTKIPNNKIISNNFKAEFKLICLPKKLINNIRNKFLKNNINILNIFCTSYVKSQTYVEKLNKNKVSFMEIGWERTTFLYYENKKLKIIQSIPVGGFHITKDISKIFTITEEDAEKLKKSFNKTYTEFSYDNKTLDNTMLMKDIINKNISIDMLKKVILYRVQEILDLTFKKSNVNQYKNILKDTEIFLIGEGSHLFKDNSFYLNDKFNFKAINFYSETDTSICNCGLINHLNNFELPKIIRKKQGLFEKFFNFFSK
ncbi:hypothetical protein OA160_02245 [Candidatus Pelagibacter sp.]|nr:hypothetical protein [Candidatus Pelagibacter sp.]